LIEQVRGTFDATDKDELLSSLATLISEDIPAIFLYTPTYIYFVDSKVTGISVNNLRSPADRFANIHDWEFTNEVNPDKNSTTQNN